MTSSEYEPKHIQNKSSPILEFVICHFFETGSSLDSLLVLLLLQCCGSCLLYCLPGCLFCSLPGCLLRYPFRFLLCHFLYFPCSLFCLLCYFILKEELQQPGFNLNFGYPWSDTCDSLRIRTEASDNEEKAKLEADLQDHLKLADEVYASLRKDCKNAKSHGHKVVIMFSRK